jgi:hypothetical protein
MTYKDFEKKKYKDFEKKPFGVLALLFIIITYGSYILALVYMILTKRHPGEMLGATVIMIEIQAVFKLLVVTVESSSVVTDTYFAILKFIWKVICFAGTFIVEVLFRKQYLKLWNFINGIDELIVKMDNNMELFKKENEKFK